VGPLLCLLPSPLLGPACWRPVAEALSDDGWAVTGVPAPRHAPRTGEDALATLLAAIPDDRDVILIPHSNAGLFVPALAAARRAVGYVFVDAGLPGAVERVPMIPAEFRDLLAGKADSDGMMPPWSGWWDEDLSGLFPSSRVRAEVEAEQLRLPLSYCEESVAIPSGWPSEPGAYLAFGDTYAQDRAAAAARGWPVITLPGEHLHMLIDPARVAAAIADLIGNLSLGLGTT
jgi:hypothetical protein